jgi:hypothetical protein
MNYPKKLDCIALSRLRGGCIEWLITNGMNMGRWTRIFGVNCIADSSDCKQFVHNLHCEFPNATISQVQVQYDSEP